MDTGSACGSAAFLRSPRSTLLLEGKEMLWNPFFLSREFQNGLLGFLWRRWVNQLQIIYFNDSLVVCEGRVKIDKTALSGQLLKVLCFMWD